MAGDEGIEGAFLPLGEAGQAIGLAQGMHTLPPAGEDLVGIGLVAHVPDDAVLRGVEHVVQGHGEFDHPQVGGQVAASAGYGLDDEFPQFVGKILEIGAAELLQVPGGVDRFKQGHVSLHRAVPSKPEQLRAAVDAESVGNFSFQ